ADNSETNLTAMQFTRMSLAADERRRGNYAGAAELYKQVLALDPAYEPALDGLEWSCQSIGRIDWVADAYARALIKDPHNLNLITNSWRVHAQLGVSTKPSTRLALP